LLESQGKQRAAAKVYHNALQTISPGASIPIEHEAWNDGSTPRAILIFDIRNPHLTAAERDLASATVTWIAKYYGESAL
jgi:hypothetical protein